MSIKAHFDGRVFVPDQPVDLPNGQRVQIQVEPANSTSSTIRPSLPDLLSELRGLPENSDWPTDGASQHDHYLYGTSKRP